MTMAFSGLDKDERQASGIDYWEGGTLWEKVQFFGITRLIQLVMITLDDGIILQQFGVMIFLLLVLKQTHIQKNLKMVCVAIGQKC